MYLFTMFGYESVFIYLDYVHIVWSKLLSSLVNHIQWSLSKSNLFVTNFCAWNRQVFSLHRLNWQRFPILFIVWLPFYAGLGLDRFHYITYIPPVDCRPFCLRLLTSMANVQFLLFGSFFLMFRRSTIFPFSLFFLIFLDFNTCRWIQT